MNIKADKKIRNIMEILVNDVLSLILIEISLNDVSKVSRLNQQWLTICRSERGRKEIERKKEEYYVTIDKIIKISKDKLFEMIQRDFISYLSRDKYINFIKKRYRGNYENIFDHSSLEMVIRDHAVSKQWIIKENNQILRELLFTHRSIVNRLRGEIDEMVIKFTNRGRMEEIDW